MGPSSFQKPVTLKWKSYISVVNKSMVSEDV